MSTEELIEQALYEFWAGTIYNLDFDKQVTDAREADILKSRELRKSGRGR